MTDEMKIKAIIERAEKNGWKGAILKDYHNKELQLIEVEKNGDISLFFGTNTAFPEIYNAYPIIFSHEFAKAYWKNVGHDCRFCGWEDCVTVGEDEHNPTGWELNLMDAVLAENPIDYYYSHLPVDRQEV